MLNAMIVVAVATIAVFVFLLSDGFGQIWIGELLTVPVVAVLSTFAVRGLFQVIVPNPERPFRIGRPMSLVLRQAKFAVGLAIIPLTYIASLQKNPYDERIFPAAMQFTNQLFQYAVLGLLERAYRARE